MCSDIPVKGLKAFGFDLPVNNCHFKSSSLTLARSKFGFSMLANPEICYGPNSLQLGICYLGILFRFQHNTLSIFTETWQ